MKHTGYLTISVDDGHPTDLKSTELLNRYGVKATFYIPTRNSEREVMNEGQIREVARIFDVGSHTLNHRPLKHVSHEEARAEIENGKKWLEDVTGKETVAFCYPKGKFNPVTLKLVREAGFLGARTCMFNLCGYPENPFLWGVSTHAYSHSIMNQGVPVVATDAVGAAAGGLVQSGVNGAVVPERDSSALAEAIGRILNDDKLRASMSQNARRIIADWNNDRMVEGFQQAINYAIQDS